MDKDLESLVRHLKQKGYLKTPEIIDAFLKIDRIDFVPESLKESAYLNIPLPIGEEQTISQPLTVAFMLELLEPKRGDKILDVGAGSGWTSALLAFMVSKENRKLNGKNKKPKISAGKIIAIERISELCEFGKRNMAKYNFIEKGVVEFYCRDGSKGFLEEAPFDKILASAAAEKIPEAWKRQLKTGGRIVAPVDNSIIELNKISEGKFEEKKFFGFSFVPLVS